ncbi:MAG TPA: recombinase family protein [Burkholderiaceae bacterium]|nr:recombinase family protein [Burkholderiaceae bacterium]
MKMCEKSIRYGYARSSAGDRNLEQQIEELTQAACSRIYSDDGIALAGSSYPGLDKLTKKLRRGDTLVVCRLDRLGHSLRDLVELIDDLGSSGIHFVSLAEGIDTTRSEGRLLFHMMAALAEFERSVISERTKAGMAAARAAGKHVGRKPALDRKQQAEIKKAYANEVPVETLAKRYAVHPRTIQRLVVPDNGQNAKST